jgi:5-methylcytosine-specific restriction endonuclease McrA
MDLRKRAGLARVIKVFEDGNRELEYENGRRVRMKFQRCPGCKIERPIVNFTMALCWECRNPSPPIEARYARTGSRYKSKRYARLKQATPPWVDRKALRSIYENAKKISKETGIPHQVDHIWPLVHECFSGLHVPWNLRIIPTPHNSSKRNTPPLAFYGESGYII